MIILSLFFHLFAYGDWLALLVWAYYMLKHYEKDLLTYQLAFFILPFVSVSLELDSGNHTDHWFIGGLLGWISIFSLKYYWDKKDDMREQLNSMSCGLRKFFDYSCYASLLLGISLVVLDG